METYYSYNSFDRRARSTTKSRTPAVRWFKEWVPQDVIATGGKCMVLKWVNEATLKATKDKLEPQDVEPEPEPSTEVLFLCSFEGCGKTFVDAGALRKHSHIHGEKQYVCHYENCGKKFLDSSKLKRHFLIHTGERDFVCPYEGCGKAFSLDFNLRSHMKTHSQENYHTCPYPDCGKRYAHEYKLKNHIASHHDKAPLDTNTTAVKYTPPPPEKPTKATKSSSAAVGPATPQRPYACPYEGCDKAYIHEYKLNLHLKREHPNHFSDEKAYYKTTQIVNDNEVAADDVSDHDALRRGKAQKKNRPKPNQKMPPSKAVKHKNNSNGNSSAYTSTTVNLNAVKKPWGLSSKEEVYEDDEDSEETEEDRENVVVGEGWRYGETNSNRNNGEEEEEEDDDEETEDED